MSYLNYPRKMLEKRVVGEIIDAVALDEWRWQVACAVAEAPSVSGFDPSRDKLRLDWLNQVVVEYRRLVREDQRPGQRGKVA